MKKKLISLISAIILMGTTALPQISYGVETLDEIGDGEEPVAVAVAVAVVKDTRWFNHENRKKEYNIYNEAQLMGFASLVNDVQYDLWKPVMYEDFQGVTFTLKRDIKLTQKWIPVGRSEAICFKGTFDGDGHTISGVKIEENGGYTGFFGYLSGKVENLNINGKVSSSGAMCGSIAGYLDSQGEISKCTNGAKVQGKAQTGGICGYNRHGKIIDCINRGNVNGTIKVGGVVGENWGEISRSGNRGDVKSSLRGATTYGTGGVAGRSVSEASKINRCYNTGNITSATEGTGGVAGYVNAKGSSIKNSYNTGNISVSNNMSSIGDKIKGYAGGVIGIAGCKGIVVQNCYNGGIIENSDISGGIIGMYFNESKVKDEPAITNNYYISSNVKYGVGKNFSGSPMNITDGTKMTSTGSLVNGAASLGGSYRNDAGGLYGSNGFPVLIWQEELTEDDRTYIPGVSRTLQDNLDRYIEKTGKKHQKGDYVMMVFDHNIFTTKAIGEYYEKKYLQPAKQ